MSKMSGFGLVFAGVFTTAAVGGAALLIALDFVGVDGLARAWSDLSGLWAAHAAETPIVDRLKGVGEIDLFTVDDVPGAPIKVHNGTAYASAMDLAQGRASLRWCYVDRKSTASSFQPSVMLGQQQGSQKPALFSASAVSPDEAKLVGVSIEALADLSHRFCRFVG